MLSTYDSNDLQNEYNLSIQNLLKFYQRLSSSKAAKSQLFEANEIIELLALNNMGLILKEAPQLKLKVENHIRFSYLLSKVIHQLLEKEAGEEHQRKVKAKEALLRFQALDREKDEEDALLSLDSLERLAQEHHEDLLIASLIDRVALSDEIIGDLKETKKELNEQLVENEKKYHDKVEKHINQSPLFNNLSDSKKREIQKRLQEICDKHDENKNYRNKHLSPARTLYEIYTEDNVALQDEQKDQDLSEEQLKEKVSVLRQELRALLEEQKKFQKQKKAVPHIEDFELHLDAFARKIVKKHDKYRREQAKIEAKINKIDQKIQAEEEKREACLQQLNKVTNPEKRARIEAQINKSYDYIERKYASKKKALQKKEHKIEEEDKTLVQAHQDIFEQKLAEEESILENTEQQLNKAWHYEEQYQQEKAKSKEKTKPRAATTSHFTPRKATYKRTESRATLIAKEKDSLNTPTSPSSTKQPPKTKS